MVWPMWPAPSRVMRMGQVLSKLARSLGRRAPTKETMIRRNRSRLFRRYVSHHRHNEAPPWPRRPRPQPDRAAAGQRPREHRQPGAQAGVARTTVLARLARLERDGEIVGYTVRLGQPRPTAACRPTWASPSAEPKAARARSRASWQKPARAAPAELGQRRVRLHRAAARREHAAAGRAARRDRRDRRRDKTTTSVVLALRVDRSA
jgi:DNA-binding Lrp family transcriptional regulator